MIGELVDQFATQLLIGLRYRVVHAVLDQLPDVAADEFLLRVVEITVDVSKRGQVENDARICLSAVGPSWLNFNMIQK